LVEVYSNNDANPEKHPYVTVFTRLNRFLKIQPRFPSWRCGPYRPALFQTAPKCASPVVLSSRHGL